MKKLKYLAIFLTGFLLIGCAVQAPHVSSQYNKYDDTNLTKVSVHSKSNQGDRIGFSLVKGNAKNSNDDYYLVVSDDEVGLIIGDRINLMIDGKKHNLKLSYFAMGKSTSLAGIKGQRVSVSKEFVQSFLNAKSISYEVKVTRISAYLSIEGDADGSIKYDDLIKLNKFRSQLV